MGKIENGIVAVTAYGVVGSITLPLLFEVYKPKERLKPEDTYRSKPEIAATMLRKLQAMGFRFNLVLADSLYGESGCGFIDVLYQLQLDFLTSLTNPESALYDYSLLQSGSSSTLESTSLSGFVSPRTIEPKIRTLDAPCWLFILNLRISGLLSG